MKALTASASTSVRPPMRMTGKCPSEMIRNNVGREILRMSRLSVSERRDGMIS